MNDLDQLKAKSIERFPLHNLSKGTLDQWLALFYSQTEQLPESFLENRNFAPLQERDYFDLTSGYEANLTEL